MNARVGKEQMLQRRVGQKDAEPRNAGRDRGAMPLRRTGASEDDGAGRRLQQCFFFWSEIAESARGVEIAHHDGERLAVAMLALAETHDGGFIRGVDAQMESADALDGEDLAGEEAVDGFGDRGVSRRG